MPSTRREMFTAMGAVAAGQLMLADAVGRDRNPAAHVELPPGKGPKPGCGRPTQSPDGRRPGSGQVP